MFDRLPDLVLLLIFSALRESHGHGADRHIRAVRLVDHHCYRVASLVLMRTVTVNGAPGSLKTLVAISKSPALGARVRNLVYDARAGCCGGGFSANPAKNVPWDLDSGRETHGIKAATAMLLQKSPHLFPLLAVAGDEHQLEVKSRDHPAPLSPTNYEIYRALVQGLSGLPALRCVRITNSSHSGAMHRPGWCKPARSDGTLSSLINVADTGSTLFVVLRALYAANTRPRQFFLAAAPDQRYHHMVSRPRTRGPGPEYTAATFADWLVPFDVECARKVFSRLQHFDVTIQGPDLEDDEEDGDIFFDSLTSFITSAGQDLRTLKIQVYDMPVPVAAAGQSIPSPWTSLLFAVIPELWRDLTELHLNGVDLDGTDLIVLLWKCPGIMALTLKHVYLTNDSPRWADILDELFPLLRAPGDGSNGGTEPRLLLKPGHLMEGIEFILDQVYEPMDEFSEGPLYLGCQELNDFFTGRTGNPLRFEDEDLC